MTDETRAAQPAAEGPEPPALPPEESAPIDVDPTSDPAGVLAVPDLAATGVAPPLVDITDEGDTAFAPTLTEETLHFGEPAPSPVVCQWCNAPLADPGAAVCPSCGGRLQPVEDDIVVPGVTTLPAEALEAELRLRRHIQDAASSASARVLGEGGLQPVVPAPEILRPAADGDPVFRPPSDEVARLMRQMELEARIAQIEREVPDEILELAEAAAAERAGQPPLADEAIAADAARSDGGAGTGDEAPRSTSA